MLRCIAPLPHHGAVAAALGIAGACAGSAQLSPGIASDDDLIQLPAQQKLLRASMALRGIRPSAEDYDRVGADPDAWSDLVDTYLIDPRFGATVRQHVTEWLELDQAPDTYPAGFPAIGPLAGLGSHELNTSIIEAPGRLAEAIVMADRSWSEIVTADYTLADSTVATVWGLPYNERRGGWQVTAYVDGRPPAGVLNDGWVFTRMPSTEGNRHRERASLIANAFICHDYPKRPVLIPQDLDLTSEAAIANAIADNPVCVSCHHTLDPLASFFAEHHALRIPEADVYGYPLEQYTLEAKEDFEAPAWYGEPGEDLRDLGAMLAEDPRFSACAVRRYYAALMAMPVADVPFEAVARFLPAFERNGMNVRDLVRDIVLSPEFSAVSIAEGSTGHYADYGPLRATPQQLDTLFDDLTGYRWIADIDETLGNLGVGQVPLLRDYLWGYRTLAGGPNNFDTVEHLRTVTPTTLLVLRGLAERAARHAVEGGAGSEALWTVSGAFEGRADAVQHQLEAWVLRFYGLPDSEDEVARLAALFDDAVTVTGSSSRAWEIVLAAMFQDPRMLLY